MGLYLVLATSDLRSAVSMTCTSFYMPLDRVALVSYEGSADELARRLDLDRTGGSGTRVGCLRPRRAATLVAGLVIALLSFGVLT